MQIEPRIPPLHCRSSYSLLAGIYSPEELCRQAAAEGQHALGLADRGNLYGLPAFYRAAARYGLKAVVAAEFAPPGSAPDTLPLFTFYPLTREGFARLNRLISRSLKAPAADPAALLLEEGWDGARIAVFQPQLLERLAACSPRGLRAALSWGLPFREMLAAAKRLRIQPLALNLALYQSEEDRRFYRLLRAVDENRPVDRESPLPAAFRRRANSDELAAYFSAVPEALRQAEDLVRDAAPSFFPGGFIFPSFRGLSAPEEFARLRTLCEQGLRRRYGRADERIRKRLSYELDIIRRKGFAGYFLVVHDIVSRCPRTCGRGSSAASIVSYLLGITHVDPLAYNLFFERFLNMGRKDPPDIDVDFPWDEREKTLRYLFETYPGRSGMVADHVTFGPRSAIREAARGFGIPEADIAPLAETYRLGEGRLPPYLAAAAGRLRGMPRHLGTHPGGAVITPGPITDYTHVETSPLGWPLIAWEKDGAEEAGLVKIDLLGNRSLGVLRDTLKLVEPKRRAAGEEELLWESFDPLGDERARRMIEEGGTLGVFYVESPATRQLLKKMRRGDYPHLIIASSIIRPAANRYIAAFLERLHGAPYRPVHPAAERVLKETCGIMVYQEDVSRVAMAVCGYTAAEADGLRKILSKKERNFTLPSLKDEFFRKGAARGVNRRVLEELFEGIRSFEGYSFCKAHSASYALVSYKLAWLKARYPLEFFCAVINNGGGFYSRQVYLNAVRRKGFPILPPDLNRSGEEYRIERRESPEGALRIGLYQLKGVDRGLIDKLLEERSRRGPYADFQDFLTRIRPPLQDVRGLIRSGAADALGLGIHRPGLFWHFFHTSRHPELFSLPPVPGSIRDYPPGVKLRDEVETLGLLISRHPAELVEPPDEPVSGRLITSEEISRYAGRMVAVPGVLVTGKEVRTRTRRDMCFLSFEDAGGIFETVLFPEVYRRCYADICRGYAFLVLGRVEIDTGAAQIEVHELIPLKTGPLDSASELCHYSARSVVRV